MRIKSLAKFHMLEDRVRDLEGKVCRLIRGTKQEEERTEQDRVRAEFVDLFGERVYQDSTVLGFCITRDTRNLQKEADFKKSRKK